MKISNLSILIFEYTNCLMYFYNDGILAPSAGSARAERFSNDRRSGVNCGSSSPCYEKAPGAGATNLGLLGLEKTRVGLGRAGLGPRSWASHRHQPQLH